MRTVENRCDTVDVADRRRAGGRPADRSRIDVMSTSDHAALPNVGEILGRILLRVPPDRQSLLIAIAERRAAERYRAWAAEVPGRRDGLLACAAREEEIASRVEALFPGAATVQREILAANPDLDEVNRALFAGRPLAQQFTIQAQGERLGAAAWRALAERAAGDESRRTLLACALLEEESATYLESLLGE